MRDPAPELEIVTAFEPLDCPDARVLILGSMPGVASLQARQYYAHPRNAFWPIMRSLLEGAPLSLPAPTFDDWPMSDRHRMLCEHGIALWDVVAKCERPGSLDSAIRTDGLEVAPIVDYLIRRSRVELVVFNGAAAERLFNRFVARDEAVLARMIEREVRLVRCLSTSGAMAGASLSVKFDQWRTIQN